MSKQKLICSEEGCDRPANGGRGMCGMHYLRKSRSGDLTEPTRNQRTHMFMEHCLSSNTDECLFPNFQIATEYPAVKIGDTQFKICILVLEKTQGKRPKGQEIRHLCGHRRCCNPKHLKWGTHLENMDDWKKHGCAGDRSGANNPNYRHGGYVK